MTDTNELARFIRGEVDPRTFPHSEHVRMAFEMLRRHDFAQTALHYSGALRAMTALLLLGPNTPMLFQGQEFAAFRFEADILQHLEFLRIVEVFYDMAGFQYSVHDYPLIMFTGSILAALREGR